jgi:hypothetical protein
MYGWVGGNAMFWSRVFISSTWEIYAANFARETSGGCLVLKEGRTKAYRLHHQHQRPRGLARHPIASVRMVASRLSSWMCDDPTFLFCLMSSQVVAALVRSVWI